MAGSMCSEPDYDEGPGMVKKPGSPMRPPMKKKSGRKFTKKSGSSKPMFGKR